jgi:hypothetical protein
LLQTTKDIITDLQDKVLNDVLPTHQKSIIQFYLRQIQSFNDVMADLGLFGLMQDILEMYKVIPRNKKGPKTMGGIKSRDPAPAITPEEEVEEGPEIVELDPNKKYNFRADFSGGYIDPFSGTSPGPNDNNNNNNNDPQKGSGGDDEDFLIYFDMKTGTIGKILRKNCASNGLIVSQTDQGEEVWDMKRAMKNKKGDRTVSKSPGANRKKYVITPRKDATGRTIGRSKSDDLWNMKVPALDKENNDIPSLPNVDAKASRRSSASSMLPTAAHTAKRTSLQKKEPSNTAPTRRSSSPSNDGWSNATSMAATRRSK